MKKFNFLSNLWSLLVGSRKDDGSTRYRLVIDSLSTRYRFWQYSLGKIAAVVCMLLTIGSGNVWGEVTSPITLTTNNTTLGYSSGTVTLTNKFDYKLTFSSVSGGSTSGYIQNAKNSNIFNTVAIPGAITSIKLTNCATTSSKTDGSFTIYGGTSQAGCTNEIEEVTGLSSTAADKTVNFDEADNYTYFKITVGSARVLKISSIVISFATGGGCDKTLTLSYDGDASGLHGSFVLKAGSASGSTIAEGGTTANCGSGTTSVVVVPTPDTHYHVASVSATNKTGDISGPDGDGNYTITYTQGSNISSTVTVTFAENPKHTLTFYNNGTQVEQIQVYEGEKIGDDLPTLTSGNACDATSNVFAGWTTENVGSTPVHSIDADQIVDYWTGPTADMSINALWATTSGSPKAQFIAENETAKTASELDPISLTKNGINLYYESGNIYHNGSAHNFGINADNYCIISTEGLVIEKAVTTCSGSSYKIADVSDGTLSGDKLSVTDVRTGSLYLFANTNNALRIVTLDVYTYDNYITTCCDKVVTLSGGSPENGTVTFSPAGSVTTCSGDQNVTMTIDPADGYQLSSFAVATGDGKVAAKTTSPSIVTGNNSSEAQETTLTFAEDDNGAYNVTASFAEMTATSWIWSEHVGGETITDSPVEVYVGQKVQVDVTYTPAGLLSSHTNNSAYSYPQPWSNSNLGSPSKAGGYFTVTGTTAGETSVSLNHIDGLTKTIYYTVVALPRVSFVDNIQGESFADVIATISGDKWTVTTTRQTPTHDDISDPGSSYNACERQHLHLAGWILSSWADEHPNATPEQITAAGASNYYAAGAEIDLVAQNGKTFYAVWSKIE